MSSSAERVKRFRERQKALQEASHSALQEGETVTPVTPKDVTPPKRPKWQAGVRPKEATDQEWEYSKQRAAGAKRYCEMFPNNVRLSEMCFQDPAWQWEHEVRKWRKL